MNLLDKLKGGDLRSIGKADKVANLRKFSPTQAHCQMGAITTSNEVIFNWLDKIMK